MQLARSDDQINIGCPLEDQLLVILRHATDHTDDLVRVLPFDVL